MSDRASSVLFFSTQPHDHDCYWLTDFLNENHEKAIAMSSSFRADTDSVLAGFIQMFKSVSVPMQWLVVLSSSGSNVKRNVKTRPRDRVCNWLAHYHQPPPHNFFELKTANQG